MGRNTSKINLDIKPKGQLLMLISLYLVLSFFSSLIVAAINGLYPEAPIQISRCIFSVASFFIPAFLLVKLVAAGKSTTYWKFTIAISPKKFLITCLLMICCIIIMNWLLQITKQLLSFKWIKEMEGSGDAGLQQYLKMKTLFQLVVNLFFFAIVPSFCEEIFFRGTMQPIWAKYFNNNWLAIVTTAFIFSLLHFQLSAFLPRFFAGIILGGIFYYTGSIWLSILSHTFYNGTVVVLNYIEQHSQQKLTGFEKMILNPALLLSATAIKVFLFYQLKKGTQTNVEPT